MKSLIASVTFALLSCMAVNAQSTCLPGDNESSVSTAQEVAAANTNEQPELNPVVYSNSYILNLKAPETDLTQSVVVNEDYKQSKTYKSGKTLRTIGIVTTAVGAAWTGVWGVGAIQCASDSNSDGWCDLGTAMLGWYAAFGLPVIGAGITMWLCGQHKMNKVKPASNGAGLAFVF